MRALYTFVGLQVADAVTTAAILSSGGCEMNPIVASALGFSPVIGMMFAKGAALAVAIAAAKLSRDHIITSGNHIYAGVVCWNLFNLSTPAGLVALAAWIYFGLSYRTAQKKAALLQRIAG